ncbi:damage-control phosphatase ARMT1 family protein [Sporomusa acidovorans]|uniref:Damage-control phosphatase ARMT1-like metal-binding domain-containing protein n=1 Tax=Sporomusa acidovorans (strain ATCC 49682 / DSM 3132 / Mol) TaxID=1123286 RepID=A0ABZ3J8U5_SPOA4|nr:ARMT1-like domain-containing protein [Sporomusa acidovorans]OZC16212.1 hypothetical protein SPACI_45790 [Sporomusa acidovorans DSM 3132]SDE31528.1 hypothetical protein SAMN04488499_101179 [Sporomusa acidovorans]
MDLNLNCILCNIRQVLTVTDLLNLDAANKEIIMRRVLGYLHAADYKRSNPEVIRGTWDIITGHVKNKDPYREIKRYYNSELSSMAGKIRALINRSNDKFEAALKIAITANLIDFAANHAFDENMLLNKITAANQQPLAIDDSKDLYEKLKAADTLLYLGDNCGEIVLDKIFIENIKAIFPGITVYFGVRGKPIVNDVTVEDAAWVHMEDVAEVISNGDGSLGTVVERTTQDFRDVFYQADVIIAKGQGNFESLSEIDRGNIFFLFMAKCEAVASALHIANLSIICAKNDKSR